MGRPADEIREVSTEVVLIPRPATPAVGGGLKRRTQFATVVLSIRTHGGLAGESYISFESIRQAQGIASVVSDAGQALLGTDSLARRSIAQILAREIHSLLPGSGMAQVLLSLADIALWDLFGKISGLPVWRLNGGSGASVECYASHGLFGGETESQLEDNARRLVEEGFRGVKLRVGHRPVAEDVSRAQLVRAAVGPEISIMVDGLWSMSSGEAIRFARAVEDLNIAWFEDPTVEGNPAELRRVRENVIIPIASAERVSSVHAFRELLDAQVLDIAIIDIYHIGGVSAWLQCAALAKERGVKVAGHAAPAYSAHLVSAAENGYVTEYFPWWDELQGEAMKPVKGAFHMTDEPGWGMPLEAAAMDRYRRELADRVVA